MMHNRTTPFNRRSGRAVIGLLTAVLGFVILAGLPSGAEADAIRTRFSFNGHWVFKQFKKERAPTLVTRIEESWTGTVPPWHREVMAALPIPMPVLPDAGKDGLDLETDGNIEGPVRSSRGRTDDGLVSSPGNVIHDARETPVTSRSGQEDDDLAVTDNAFGHSGQEFFERPSDHADG